MEASGTCKTPGFQSSAVGRAVLHIREAVGPANPELVHPQLGVFRVEGFRSGFASRM